ncbi:hypothetical protein DBL06_12705 [Agrobacterium pusense]|nr:hypothetical protein AYO27_12430 [Rhizobium sp. GHKF11]PTV74371.1 hypothetical protein DBL06_12705 [Agrobacterium pusense]
MKARDDSKNVTVLLRGATDDNSLLPCPASPPGIFLNGLRGAAAATAPSGIDVTMKQERAMFC